MPRQPGRGRARKTSRPSSSVAEKVSCADAAGRVYVANGQIFVYSPNGEELGRIDVPERPLQILLGGANRADAVHPDPSLALFGERRAGG